MSLNPTSAAEILETPAVSWPGVAEWSQLEVSCRLADGEEVPPVRWVPRGGGRSAARCGPLELELELEPHPLGAVARVTARALADCQVAEVALSSQLSIGSSGPEWVLYNGYQSWDPSGHARVRAGLRSWWTVGLADGAGRGLAAAARSARDSCTCFELQDGGWRIVWREAEGLERWPTLLRGDAGTGWRSEEVLLAAGPDVRSCLGALAGRAATDRVPTGWLSWYGLGPFVTREEVLANARVLARDPYRRLGYRLVQVDDGWQVAYGDWSPNARFPGGLEELCRELERRGQVLGLWIAPFLVSAGSDLAHQAPEDWFVRDPRTGERAIDPLHRVFGPMHVLDASRPAVQEHLHRLFCRLRSAGVGYFKIDFLYAGGYGGLKALRGGVEAIRRGVGDAYLLACGAPLLPVVGLVDGCRIGCDTATPVFDAETGLSTPTMFGDEVRWVARNAAARHFLRGWFQLDPDVALVGGEVPLERARQLVTIAALSGGPFFAGDDLGRLAPERQRLLTNPEVLALVGGSPAVPDWEAQDGEVASHWRRDGVLAVFDWSGEERTVAVRAPGARGARDLWNRTELSGFGDGTRLKVPAHGVRLLRLRR